MSDLQRKNWWGRNWKWFVPVGCLGSLVLFAGFIALLVGLVFGMMKSSGAYEDAMAEVQSHAEVQQALGTPVEAGVFVTGNISLNNSSGNADLAIPLSGPDGKATVYVVASKSAGQWTFSTLTMELKDTGERIDLLE